MPESAVLERMLVEADPARTPRDAMPDAAALRQRDRIMGGIPKPQPERRVALRLIPALAAVAAAASIVFAFLVPQGEAVAGTPRPLDFSDAGSVDQILSAANVDLTALSGPATPERLVRSASWTFDIEVEEKQSEVVPQLTTLMWEPDLSGHMTIISGVPYDPADAAAHQGSEISSSGEVVTELTFRAGEFGTPVAEPPGDSEEAVAAMLEAFAMPREPTAGEAVSAIVSVLDQWTLTNAQQA